MLQVSQGKISSGVIISGIYNLTQQPDSNKRWQLIVSGFLVAMHLEQCAFEQFGENSARAKSKAEINEQSKIIIFTILVRFLVSKCCKSQFIRSFIQFFCGASELESAQILSSGIE